MVVGQHWRVFVNGRTSRPVSRGALATAIESGKIAGDCQCQCVETGEWSTAQEVAYGPLVDTAFIPPEYSGVEYDPKPSKASVATHPDEGDSDSEDPVTVSVNVNAVAAGLPKAPESGVISRQMRRLLESGFVDSGFVYSHDLLGWMRGVPVIVAYLIAVLSALVSLFSFATFGMMLALGTPVPKMAEHYAERIAELQSNLSEADAAGDAREAESVQSLLVMVMKDSAEDVSRRSEWLLESYRSRLWFSLCGLITGLPVFVLCILFVRFYRYVLAYADCVMRSIELRC